MYEHNPGDHEDPVAGPTWIIGFLGAVLMVVITLGVSALYYRERTEQDKVVVVDRNPRELEDLRAAQSARLSAAAHWENNSTMEEVKEGGKTYNVITTTKSLIIPIEQAMADVVKEAGARKPVAMGQSEMVGTPERIEQPAKPAAETSGGTPGTGS
ncbi:MAG TPA: hypothetical protein VG711_03255 [Phycisphaerales bacterium]|nr:hypothetical protein [Phycisphaerales bacterium]